METSQAENPREAEITPLLKPAFVASHQGEARWWGGGLAVIKASASDTGGQMTIVEVTEPPGAEAPLHVHHNEDEAFWVLDGAVTFEIGGTTVEAGRDAGCRMLFILTPGGFEDVVIAMSEPAGARTLPPPSTEEPDMAAMKAIAAAHGAEILDG